MEQRGGHVGQPAVLHFGRIVVRHIDERHRIERVGRVGRAVFVDGVVGIAMVGDDDGLIAGGLGGLDHLLHALVYRPDGFGNGVVNARVAHHVAVGEVHNDEVVQVFLDGRHELVLHLERAHLRLQVVGRHLR